MIYKAFKEVFSRWGYITLSAIVFFAFLIFAIWLPNLTFIKHAALSETFSFTQKIGIISSTISGFKTNFSPMSRILTLTLSLLLAVNISFFIFYLLRVARLNREAGIGTGGLILGILGIGCASCGSVILSGLFGVGATASFLGVFPLKGKEFGILGITLLSVSIYILSKKIINPLVCKAKPLSFKPLFLKTPVWLKVTILIVLSFLIGAVFAN